jgi:hypothetical protein
MNRTHVLMALLVLIAPGASSSWGAESGAGPATTQAATSTRPRESAIEAAQRYAAMAKDRRPRDAIAEFLDLDQHLRRMFGEDFDKCSIADKQEMRRLLESLFDEMYADPHLVDAMAAARYENFRELSPHNAGEADLKIVAFDAVLGEQRTTNRLFLRPIEGRWRIVDLSGGGASVAIATRAQYLPQRDHVTPLQFIRELAKPALEPLAPSPAPSPLPATKPAGNS